MKIHFLYFMFLIFLSACAVQPQAPGIAGRPQFRQDRPLNPQPGKCYHKSYLSDEYCTQWASYPLYTGSEKDAPIQYKEMLIIPPKTEWQKNSNGEVVYVETSPAVMKKIAILSDTVRYKDFRIQQVEYKVMTQKRGYKEFVEVVCGEHMSENLIRDISAALVSHGYVNSVYNKWSPELVKGLAYYQSDHSLPIGGIDYKTLAALGVKAP